MLDRGMDESDVYKVDDGILELHHEALAGISLILHEFLRRSLSRAPTVIGRWPKTPRSFGAHDMYIDF